MSELEAPDLLESEIMAVGEVYAHLMSKYAHRPDTFANLTSFRKEAEERFRDIGLIVEVQTLKVGEPTIEIVGRTNEYDHEQQAYEVKKGVADPYWDRKRKQQE